MASWCMFMDAPYCVTQLFMILIVNMYYPLCVWWCYSCMYLAWFSFLAQILYLSWYMYLEIFIFGIYAHMILTQLIWWIHRYECFINISLFMFHILIYNCYPIIWKKSKHFDIMLWNLVSFSDNVMIQQISHCE